VSIERLTVELRQRIDLTDARIDAVADRNIDQALVTTQRHRRLGAGEREWLQACAGTATEDDRENTLHVQVSRFRMIGSREDGLVRINLGEKTLAWLCSAQTHQLQGKVWFVLPAWP